MIKGKHFQLVHVVRDARRRPAGKAVIKSAASAASPEGFPSRDQVGR